MAAQVELDAGRTGVVGARLHLSPLADASNTSLMEGSTCPQGALILTSEPSKPAPGPKPRLTPKPFAVEKNPTIRPILAPKPQPKPRPDPTRLSTSKPDPPSTPKPTLTTSSSSLASASKPKPVSTGAAPNTATRPTSTFPAKPAAKLGSGQTSKPVAQPFKPAPPLASDQPRKPPPSQVAKKPASAGPAVLQKRGGLQAARSAAEWSGPTRQKPAGSTMTRAKSLGFLTEVGLTEAEPKDGGGRERDGGPRAMDVTATAPAPVALRPQNRGGRPRPVSAIFLPDSAAPDAQSVGGGGNGGSSRWAGRRPLSADLTSKFETAGLSVHHRAASKENLPEPTRGEQQDNEEAERTRTRGSGEKEKERGSGDGTEDKGKVSAAQERTGGGESRKQEAGEGREDTKGGGSIKRRISLLLDSSALSVPGGGRTSADGVETRSSAQPIPNAPDKAVGVRQRIRELTEDTPLSQSPPQKPVVKPRPLPRDFTKRYI